MCLLIRPCIYISVFLQLISETYRTWYTPMDFTPSSNKCVWKHHALCNTFVFPDLRYLECVLEDW
jgi:hypothetical protein